MSRYIDVATPTGSNYLSNNALTEILSFLGRKYKETHTGIYVRRRSDFAVGLHYIAKKCGRWHKTAIKNLIYSKRKCTYFNIEYQNWRFHKAKAKKFFDTLYMVLNKLNAPNDVWIQFKQLYNTVSRSFPIDKRGSHVISYPYRDELNQIENDRRYSSDDREVITRINRAFSAYDQLYQE